MNKRDIAKELLKRGNEELAKEVLAFDHGEFWLGGMLPKKLNDALYGPISKGLGWAETKDEDPYNLVLVNACALCVRVLEDINAHDLAAKINKFFINYLKHDDPNIISKLEEALKQDDSYTKD